MNRLEKHFELNQSSLIVFFTAGDPSLVKTIEFILDAEKAGADVIEIGIPFSDPLAEGEVIQAANLRALSNNIKVDDIFNMVKEVRKHTSIPLVFLTYANPVYFYGYEAFFKQCQESGIDGIILPDIPFESQTEIKSYTSKYDVKLISLIAPTSKERIKQIATQSEGFVYTVSSLGVTGVRENITTDLQSMVQEIKQHTNTKVAVGFGISTPEQIRKYSTYFDGCIVGSAIVRIIAKYKEDANDYLIEYIFSLKNAMQKKS